MNHDGRRMDERLRIELLMLLAGDDSAEVDALLAKHPEARREMLELRESYASLAPRIESWARRAHARAPLPPSASISGYHLLEEIGHGGAGIVYRAEEVSSGRRVALKVLHSPGHANARERFHREVEAISRIENPQVVKLLGWGAEGDVFHIATELLDGETFAALIARWRSDRSPSRFGRAAEVVVDACAALESIHALGIIHRDMKPSNIFITRDGAVKLLDFGLVRSLEDPTITETGGIVGTAAYMSPEQLLGDRRRIDRRADVYALGASLYEAVALRRPFGDGDSAAGTIVDGDPPPPHEREPAAPRDLSSIIQKAMEWDPSRRYATAGDLALDLRRFLQGDAVSAPLIGGWGRLERKLRRRKRLLAGLFLGVALLGAVAWGVHDAGSRLARRAAADEALRRGQEAAGVYRRLRQEVLPAEARAAGLKERRLSLLDDYSTREPLFRAEERVEEIRQRLRVSFDEAVLSLQRGLEIDPSHAGLHRLLDDLLWTRFLEIEQGGDTEALQRVRAQILNYAPARGGEIDPHGTVSVLVAPHAARGYLFRYEARGPLLQPMPFHPLRGRLMAAEDLPRPRLRVTGAVHALLSPYGIWPGDEIVTVAGRPAGISGNRVLALLHRGPLRGVVEFEREGRAYVVQFPLFLHWDEAGDEEKPAILLNASLEHDAFPLAVLEEGACDAVVLRSMKLPAGSYLLLLRLAGHQDVRVPFVVRRGERRELPVRQFRSEEVPAGFMHVPAGPAWLGGDTDSLYPEAGRSVDLPDYFISRREVSAAEYFEFLNDPAIRAEIEAPDGEAASLLLPVEVRSDSVVRRYDVDPAGRPAPGSTETALWGMRWVSRLAADRFVRWMNEKESEQGGRWRYALPSADELEKAARGADGRLFPWGNKFDWSLVCGHRSSDTQTHRTIPFPTDASPYDVRDLAGSLAEWTRTDETPPGSDAERQNLDPRNLDCRVKGGSGFDDLEIHFHAGGHTRERKRERNHRIGFRLVAYPGDGAR
jgi:formylglycine-generating enzyme required for sulfatase activity